MERHDAVLTVLEAFPVPLTILEEITQTQTSSDGSNAFALLHLTFSSEFVGSTIMLSEALQLAQKLQVEEMQQQR